PPALVSRLLCDFCHRAHRQPLSFPTRRSSDLSADAGDGTVSHGGKGTVLAATSVPPRCRGSGVRSALDRLRPTPRGRPPPARRVDRKSTRLNSSHVKTSYAVFCLKNKS